MSIIQSIILGIVQGLTEFLPVSSSAHLNLFPWVFGWQEMPESFDGYQKVDADNLLMCLFDIDVTPRCIGLIKNKIT